MPRSLTVGNGNIVVNMDSHLQVRDFTFPYVGQQNHVGGHTHRWGVWVDGRMFWSTDPGWKFNKKYKQDMLVTECHMEHEEAKLKLRINDLVHYENNVFIRKFNFKNLADHDRDIRLFLHQDFHLYQDEVGDTVSYMPKRNVVIHYKRKRYMLMGGLTQDGSGMKQYTCGQKSWDHNHGTWHDADDGELSMNPVAQGSVDSTIRFDITVRSQHERHIHFWIVAGKDFEDAFKQHDTLIASSPERLKVDTQNFWKSWVTKQDINFQDLDAPIVRMFNRSLLTVRTQIDNRGAITAANDSDNLQYNKDSYSYLWPRDGAFVSLALDKAGYHEITRRFFKFCEKVLSKPGYLLHKFNPDGSLGSSWHPWIHDGHASDPIQEDETALVLYSLWEHYELTKDIEFVKPLYEEMVVRMGDFLVRYRDPSTRLPKPSYDLWEEQYGIFTFTTCTVVAALKAASSFAKLFGDKRRADLYYRAAEETREALLSRLYHDDEQRFAKKATISDGKLELDMTVDASLFALFYFDILPPDHPKVASTMDAVKERLSVIDGIARYENDFYHRKEGYDGPGNPWIICTLWLADWYIAKATTHEELAPAVSIMKWVCRHANPAGLLAEQLDPHHGKPLSVAPLTWSHSSLVSTVLDYVAKYKKLSEGLKNAD